MPEYSPEIFLTPLQTQGEKETSGDPTFIFIPAVEFLLNFGSLKLGN
jgi:hypothetical protein